MGGASKEKGTAWELEVAKLLEKNFDGKFSRVPRSGAMFGGENIENAQNERTDVVEIFTGDIITPREFPFTVEAKHYDDFKFSHILKGESKLLNEWLDSVSSDAKLANKYPLIISKFNYMGIYTVFGTDLISEVSGICPSTFFENHLVYNRNWIIVTIEEFLSVKNIIVDFAKLKIKQK